MEKILEAYGKEQFSKCIQLIKQLPESDDVNENFVHENCLLLCESMVKLYDNDPDEILETEEALYLFFDKVTSLGVLSNSISFKLRLTATFNLMYWLLFYNDNELSEEEIVDYLEVVNKGLLLSKQGSLSECSSIVEKIIENLHVLSNTIPEEEDRETVFLIIELIVVVILYVLKLKRHFIKQCLHVVSGLVINIQNIIKMVIAISDFSIEKPVPIHLFKFGLDNTATLVSASNSNVTDYLYILESILLFMCEDFRSSLKSLQKNNKSTLKNLWHYLASLNFYNLEKWESSLGFALKASKMVSKESFKVRCCILLGKLHCEEGNHKEALKCFQEALSLSSSYPEVYYYIGQEYGKMGLYDLMIESFERLVKAVKSSSCGNKVHHNFEDIILDWIHSSDEICKSEALYALAVSYGLNERFSEATETFEEILQMTEIDKNISSRRKINFPNFCTILHDAAIMNLLTGNIVRAEQIATDASEQYVPQSPPSKQQPKDSLLNRDVAWLQKIIEQELLENELEAEEPKTPTLYSEEVIFCFPENVIALLIMAEIQKIQESEDYKATLSKILAMLSSYMSSMYKKEGISEDEDYVWTLVKALTGKTCLRIAMVLMRFQDVSNIERMFKRALSCNKGDKDVLYNYYSFLVKIGKNREAYKLWRTFYKEETTVTVDSLQSFALRYFLSSQISDRDLDKIQKDLEFSQGECSTVK